MNADTMRSIDLLAGVPLCWLGTQLRKLVPYKAILTPPKNILFIELSEMGSAVLADPAMKKLQRTFDANLHFVIFAKNRESLTLLDTVPPQNIFVIREGNFRILTKDTINFLIWARKRNIDTVIDLELFSRFTALLTGFCGASRRVGFHAFHNEGLYRGNLLTHKVPYNAHMHIAKNFIALSNALLNDENCQYSKAIIHDDEITLEKIQIPDSKRVCVLESIKKEAPHFDEHVNKIIIFNTNASEMLPQRCWPAENYAQLARIIIQQYENVYILFTGLTTEREGINSIIAEVGNPHCLNFAGKTTLLELIALYSMSEFMLSNDSGPAHFAAVTNMQTYTFFGPETPLLYGPLGKSVHIYAGIPCSPCVSAANHRKTSCQDNVCLHIFTPQHILDILKPSLMKLTTRVQ
jgi:ADP-heptose:LPS heptosyltransferase